MSRRLLARMAAAGLVALSPTVVSSQGLGAAAEREKARRSGKGTSSKVYGDGDLKTNPGQIANADGTESSPPPARTENEVARLPARRSAGEDRSARERSEAEWRQRAAGPRRAVEAAERRVKQLEEDLVRAEAERRLDPYPGSYAYSRVTAAQRRLEQARTDLVNARKAVEDLEDEARRAGALPGWLR